MIRSSKHSCEHLQIVSWFGTNSSKVMLRWWHVRNWNIFRGWSHESPQFPPPPSLRTWQGRTFCRLPTQVNACTELPEDTSFHLMKWYTLFGPLKLFLLIAMLGPSWMSCSATVHDGTTGRKTLSLFIRESCPGVWALAGEHTGWHRWKTIWYAAYDNLMKRRWLWNWSIEFPCRFLVREPIEASSVSL